MGPEDGPDATQLNRKLVLTLLNLICAASEKRKKQAEGFRKLFAEQMWMAEQLWKHVPKEAQKQVLTDYLVNQADPDFCFYKAIFGDDPKPIP